MLCDVSVSGATWPCYFLLGRGLASCLRITRHPLRYLCCQGRWALFLYCGQLGLCLAAIWHVFFAKIAHFFNLGSQTVVFPLQMFDAILQFPHPSCLLFLFLLHVLTPMKKLIFGRLNHRVSSHCTCVRRIRCRYGNHRSYWW